MKDNVQRCMFYLYILKSSVSNRHYIGHTNNLDNRLMRHNQKEVRSTKAYTPWKLVYSETYQTKTEARKREIELKRHTWKRQEIFNKTEMKYTSGGPIV